MLISLHPIFQMNAGLYAQIQMGDDGPHLDSVSLAADGGLLIVVFGSSLPLSTNTKIVKVGPI